MPLIICSRIMSNLPNMHRLALDDGLVHSSPFFGDGTAATVKSPQDLEPTNSVEVRGLPEVFILHEKDVRLDL